MPALRNLSFDLRTALAAISTFIILTAATAQGQTPEDYVHSLINQKLILRHMGEMEHVKLKRSQLDNPPGSCDIAVAVERAEWDRGTVRFEFEDIGHPRVEGSAPGSSCKTVHTNTALEIKGFAQDELPDSLRTSISEILLTPEQYIAAEGASFDLAPRSDDEVIFKVQPPVRPPRALLSVDPNYSEEARRAKYQGTMRLNVVVGADGRPHTVAVSRSLGKGLDEMAVKVLPMWRFEPAKKDDKPVAVEISVEVSFNLY